MTCQLHVRKYVYMKTLLVYSSYFPISKCYMTISIIFRKLLAFAIYPVTILCTALTWKCREITVSRQFVYRLFVYNTSSTDISSTAYKVSSTKLRDIVTLKWKLD